MRLCHLRITPLIFLIIGFAVLTEGRAKVRFRSGGVSYGGAASSVSGSGGASVGMILGIFFGSLGGIILFIVFCVFLAKCCAKQSMRRASPKAATRSGQLSKNKAFDFSSSQQQFDTVAIPFPDMATPFPHCPPLPSDNLPAYDSVWTGHTALPYPASPPACEMSTPSAPPQSQTESTPDS
ncbi:uncharacterized protein LOC112566468 [Pomacea canaliculata]|uniref:uncharacterized protein LOC112566468 n=1 Tax=Pomacea canaliculata TaxID=400727 RepID=UPI000D733B2A|nr:uncharacterized protein LOC112566468 [Pomacea canaliculata]